MNVGMAKGYLRLLMLGLLAVASAISLRAEVLEWRFDGSHSAASFAVKHMMVTTVRGQFSGITGKVLLDPANPLSAVVEASIPTATVNTGNAKRDEHLKSADFFEVEKYPSMSFRSKRVYRDGSGSLKMTGDLTIKGVTREVTFDIDGPTPVVKDQRGTQRVGASASAKISRKDFNILWNRAIETGGVVVGDEVTITLDVALIHQAKP